MILIITEKFDPHTDRVTEELDKRNVPFTRFHLSDFPSKTSISYYIAVDDSKDVMTFSNNRIYFDDISTVWYRRIERFEFPEQLSDADREIAKRECHSFIRGLWRKNADTRWISNPDRLRDASSKPEQLQRAKKLGFRVPPTCFTNDPATVTDLYELFKSSDGIVYKAHSPVFSQNEDGTVGVVYTQKLDRQKMKKVKDIVLAPGIFQAFIPKQFDIRVTVIGGKAYGCKIDSQRLESTKVDFRSSSWQKDEVPPHSRYDLAPEISRLCVKLVKDYGLEFGAIDLVMGEDKNIYFLELNPNGQWVWIEDLTGMPLVKNFVDLLTEEESAEMKATVKGQ